MRVAIVADTHWGIRNDSPVFLRQIERWSESFFRYCRQNRIRSVIHLGDLVDRRKYINYRTAQSLRNHWVYPILEQQMDCYVIAGNHDVFFTNTNEVNALRELLPNTEQFRTFDRDAATLDFEGVKVQMLPWICPENHDRVMRAVSETSAMYCCAHLELKGHDMYRGQPMEHGMDAAAFSRFNRVLTGHFHTMSHRGNIHYVGAACEYAWSDYDDPRGFWVFDTDDHSFTHVVNEDRMHRKVHVTDPHYALDPGAYADKVVKLIVPRNADQAEVERVLSAIEGETPAGVQVVDDHLNMDALDEVEVQAGTDTLDLLRECAASLGQDVDGDRLTELLVELYREAQTTGV